MPQNNIHVLTKDPQLSQDLLSCLHSYHYECLSELSLSDPSINCILIVDLATYTLEQQDKLCQTIAEQSLYQFVIYILEVEQAPPKDLKHICALIWRPLRDYEVKQRIELVLQHIEHVPQFDFYQVFEKHHAIMLLIDPQRGQIVDANPAASRFYGYSRHTLKQMSLHHINQLNQEQIKLEMKKAQEQEVNYFTFVHRLANGELRTVEVHSTPLDIQGQQLLFSIIHDITRRTQTEKALQQSEEQYRKLFQLAPIGIGVVSIAGKIMAFNDEILRPGGYKRAQVLDLNSVTDLYYDPAESKQVYAEFCKQGQVIGREIRVRHSQEGYYDAVLTMAPIQFENQVCLLILLEDITQRKQQELQIQKSLEEREVLLREIHHRVKNNFQVMISLLNLQMRKLGPHSNINAIEQSRNRIRSIALFHERLYHSSSLVDLNFADYLKYLAHEIHVSNPNYQSVKLSFDLQDVFLNIDQATPCGLLSNELLSNAFRFAFASPWQGEAEIKVILKRNQDEVILQIADNGQGLGSALENTELQGLGLYLTQQLVRQLEGNWQVLPQAGTCWHIRFPLQAYQYKQEWI